MKKLILLFAVLTLNVACTLEDTREDYWVETAELTDNTSSITSKGSVSPLPDSLPLECLHNYALPISIKLKGSYIYRITFTVVTTDGVTFKLPLLGGKHGASSQMTHVSTYYINQGYSKAGGESATPYVSTLSVTVSSYGAVHREKTYSIDGASYYSLGFDLNTNSDQVTYCNVQDLGIGISMTATGYWPGDISLVAN